MLRNVWLLAALCAGTGLNVQETVQILDQDGRVTEGAVSLAGITVRTSAGSRTIPLAGTLSIHTGRRRRMRPRGSTRV